MDQFREDISHSLPPMPGNRDSVGGGVREKDGGRGTLLTGAAEGKGAV